MLKAKKKKPTALDSGRRALTVYMFPDTITALKHAAMTDEKHDHAYEIVEEAVLEWLARKKKPSRKR